MGSLTMLNWEWTQFDNPATSELNFEMGRAEARGPKGRERGWGFWGEGQPAPSPPARRSGERCKLPAGSAAEPRSPKGFLALCATRLPPSPCVDLGAAYWYTLAAMRVTGDKYVTGPPHRELGYMSAVSHRFQRLCDNHYIVRRAEDELHEPTSNKFASFYVSLLHTYSVTLIC